MPITLPPISRRRFLAGSVAAGVALATQRWTFAQDATPDPDRFVLIADTHIDADAARLNREVNMSANLRATIAAILALPSRPAAVLHGGDVAHSTGEAGDYATLVGLLKPLREAGIPLHLTLGNHDHRERFWTALPPGDAPKPVDAKHTLLVESPKADWYLLDSLDKTNVTPGLVGEQQLVWLAKSLDARPTKPAIVMTHHHPKVGEPRPFGGLVDFQRLFDVINPRKQVKLLVYGHTHDFNIVEETPDRPHRINLPPTSYVFGANKPSGWIDCTLTDTSARFKLVTIDPKGFQNGKTATLQWR